VNPIFSLDAVERRKIFSPVEDRKSIDQPEIRHFGGVILVVYILVLWNVNPTKKISLYKSSVLTSQKTMCLYLKVQ
jgi:hypothetical protein